MLREKYGIYNNVSKSGDNIKYGIYNFTKQEAEEFSYGLYNEGKITNDTATHYGIYNRIIEYSSPLKQGGRTGFYNYVKSSSVIPTYGFYSEVYSYGEGLMYGLYSKVTPSNSNTGARYGLYTRVRDRGTGTSYGIYSNIEGGSGYAGYFIGDVHATGTITCGSDESLKQNITPISNALEVIGRIKPRQYQYRDKPSHGLKAGRLQFGFLAQDLEEVLPSLVHAIKHPGEMLDEGEEEGPNSSEAPTHPANKFGPDSTHKGIDYQGVIAILVQGMQEQQAQIEALKKEVEELKKR